jgi:hypothetical protein
VVGTGVETNLNAIKNWESFMKSGMDRFDGFAALGSTANVWLIRYDDQEKARFLQLPATLDDVGIKLELLDIRGRVGEAVADNRSIQNAVAIEKDGALT